MNKRSLLFCSILALGALSVSQAPAAPIEAGATVASAAADTPVEFEIFLPLRNKAAMRFLHEAQQTPGSAQYHQWLTPAQFATQFGPTPESMARAKTAAEHAGLTVTATNPRSFHVMGDAAHVNAFLKTRLMTITTKEGRARMSAVVKPVLPTELQAEGAQIAAFSPIPERRTTAIKVPAGSAVPDNRYTATGSYWFDDLKQAYGYPAYTASVGGNTVISDGTGVSVAVLMADLPFPGDISAMFAHEKFKPLTGKPAPKAYIHKVDGGGVYNGYGSFEASLDLQQVLGGAPGATVTLVSIPNLNDSSIIDGYNFIVNSDTYDLVNSSFGGCELYYTAAYNGGTDYTYILAMEDEIFFQGNLEGITFVASSGDDGAVMCVDTNYFSGVSGTYVTGVSSPADDPNVTAVGGGNLITTKGPKLNSAYVSETAYGDPQYPSDPFGVGVTDSGGYWAAGGGVSSVFSRPLYQRQVNTGSTTGRTVPDVGMQVGGLGFSMLNGTNPGFCDGAISCSADDSSVLTAYGVHYGGGFYFTIGTSVSSPEFVGALALYAQTVPRHRLGNVNPYLYNAGAAQTLAGGTAAPAAQQYFHRGMQGFDGYYAGGYPTANYDYIYGNGSPNVAALFGLTAGGLAGVPQTATNP